ncbi:hypothetical protein [Pseudotamlana carrageenivorans]|uniref:Uncharacterized protein n=1 Tax=Pseudotamlana carrageenivorans TaxID=2069432 RepID=A0A2I7SKT0_9FLAO|nr:hypothetical protein [Tamlana carrageenivorans]AUS06493.1 hypothetical protein C1A40_14025 [Tamlana carrageenivorans]
MNVVLSFIAQFLFAFVGVVDSVFQLFYKVKNKKWYKTTNGRSFKKALNIDVFGNYQYNELWNVLFSKNGYQFGRFGETMSSCFGKKQKEKSLTWFGWMVLFLINTVDVTKWVNGFKGKGFHCEASIQSDAAIADFIK